MKIENLIRDKYKNLNETEKEILYDEESGDIIL